MIKKLTYILVVTTILGSFAAGWFARPVIQSTKEYTEIVEIIDGKTTKTISKKTTPTVVPVSAYMPKYSISASTGFDYQRYGIGYRIFGQLWGILSYSPQKNQAEIGVQIQF